MVKFVRVTLLSISKLVAIKKVVTADQNSGGWLSTLTFTLLAAKSAMPASVDYELDEVFQANEVAGELKFCLYNIGVI